MTNFRLGLISYQLMKVSEQQCVKVMDDIDKLKGFPRDVELRFHKSMTKPDIISSTFENARWLE